MYFFYRCFNLFASFAHWDFRAAKHGGFHKVLSLPIHRAGGRRVFTSVLLRTVATRVTVEKC